MIGIVPDKRFRSTRKIVKEAAFDNSGGSVDERSFPDKSSNVKLRQLPIVLGMRPIKPQLGMLSSLIAWRFPIADGMVDDASPRFPMMEKARISDRLPTLSGINPLTLLLVRKTKEQTRRGVRRAASAVLHGQKRGLEAQEELEKHVIPRHEHMETFESSQLLLFNQNGPPVA